MVVVKVEIKIWREVFQIIVNQNKNVLFWSVGSNEILMKEIGVEYVKQKYFGYRYGIDLVISKILYCIFSQLYVFKRDFYYFLY